MFITFRIFFDLIIDFAFGFYWAKYRKNVPDLDESHKALSLSATQLAKDIREKRLKSEDLVKACIERIKAVSLFKITFYF